MRFSPHLNCQMYLGKCLQRALLTLRLYLSTPDSLEEEGAGTPQMLLQKKSVSALLVVVAFLVIAFEVTMPWSLSIIGFGLDKAVDHSTWISPYYSSCCIRANNNALLMVFMSLTALYSGILKYP